jgi:hypothetical protein
MVTHVNILMPLCVLAILLAAGCTGISVPSQEQAPAAASCRNVTEQKPVVSEQCSQVQSTEQVCGLRKLPYTVASPPKLDICIIDGDCVGKPLSQCPGCTTAMTRCTLIIKNDDPQKSGTWKVGANFTLLKSGFNKDPISITIRPNETAAFDFQQIYGPGDPVNSATCNISISEEAVVEDCHQETRPKTECRNVTTMTTVSRQVCG